MCLHMSEPDSIWTVHFIEPKFDVCIIGHCYINFDRSIKKRAEGLRIMSRITSAAVK